MHTKKFFHALKKHIVVNSVKRSTKVEEDKDGYTLFPLHGPHNVIMHL